MLFASVTRWGSEMKRGPSSSSWSATSAHYAYVQTREMSRICKFFLLGCFNAHVINCHGSHWNRSRSRAGDRWFICLFKVSEKKSGINSSKCRRQNKLLCWFCANCSWKSVPDYKSPPVNSEWRVCRVNLVESSVHMSLLVNWQLDVAVLHLFSITNQLLCCSSCGLSGDTDGVSSSEHVAANQLFVSSPHQQRPVG